MGVTATTDSAVPAPTPCMTLIPRCDGDTRTHTALWEAPSNLGGTVPDQDEHQGY